MALHTRDGGFVMPNAWDGLSALMLADAGFEAIATSSAALAFTLGRLDGRHEVTREEHPEHARLVAIVTAVAATPVNVLVSPADKVLTVPELQKIGVKRISLGPMLYANAMGALEHATKALVAGDLAAATTGMSFDRIGALLAGKK